MLNVALHNINRLHRLFEKATGVGKKKKNSTLCRPLKRLWNQNVEDAGKNFAESVPSKRLT